MANKKEIRQKKREERRIKEWARNNYSTSAQIMYLAVHYYSYITIFIAESLKFHFNNLGCCHSSPKKRVFWNRRMYRKLHFLGCLLREKHLEGNVCLTIH